MSDQTTNAPAEEPKQTQVDLTKVVEALSQITNSQGQQKYSDPVKAVESIPHAQNHIQKLEQDNKALKERLDEMNAKLDKVASTEEHLNQLAQQMKDSQTQTEQPPVAALDDQSLDQKFNDLYARKTQEQKDSENLSKFAANLGASNNDEVINKVQTTARAKGVGVDLLLSMAKQNPEAALAFMDVEPSNVSKPVSSINTESMQGKPAPALAPLGVVHTSAQAKADRDAVINMLNAKHGKLY